MTSGVDDCDDGMIGLERHILPYGLSGGDLQDCAESHQVRNHRKSSMYSVIDKVLPENLHLRLTNFASGDVINLFVALPLRMRQLAISSFARKIMRLS